MAQQLYEFSNSSNHREEEEEEEDAGMKMAGATGGGLPSSSNATTTEGSSTQDHCGTVSDHSRDGLSDGDTTDDTDKTQTSDSAGEVNHRDDQKGELEFWAIFWKYRGEAS